MVSPINYAIDVQSPFAAVGQGLQLGAAMRQDQLAQQQEQAAAAAAQAQARAQAQMQADLSGLANHPNPTANDYSAIMTKYPQLSENLKRGWDVRSEGQKQAGLNQSMKLLSALNSGKPEIAIENLRADADAARNSGNEEYAKNAEAVAEMVRVDPKQAENSVWMKLAAVTGPKDFADTYAKVKGEQRATEQAPAELREKLAAASKGEAEATIAGEKAKTAKQDVLLDLEKKGWDIKKLEEDVRASTENTKIRAMEAAISRETNDLKRQELRLKIDETKDKQAEKLREKVSTTESAAASIDNLSNTVDRILKNPELSSVVGSIQGRAPAIFSDEAANAISLIEQLGSQAFIAQIPQMKGTGSLSEKEGDKLQASLQNLSRVQGEKQFRYNLEEVLRLMGKARERLSKSTGIPLPAPDRPNAPPREEDAGGKPKPGTPEVPQRNVSVEY